MGDGGLFSGINTTSWCLLTLIFLKNVSTKVYFVFYVLLHIQQHWYVLFVYVLSGRDGRQLLFYYFINLTNINDASSSYTVKVTRSEPKTFKDLWEQDQSMQVKKLKYI
jgi:hypothetical protein